MNYYLVRAKFGGFDDKTKEFIEKSYWKSGYKDRYKEIINQIQEGDLLLLADGSYIRYIAKCKSNPKDGQMVYVDSWQKISPIYFRATGAYIKTISSIKNSALIAQIESKLKELVNNFKINRLKLINFMSFKNKSIEFSNINIFIGDNGSGKSQLLKLCYSLILSNNDIYKQQEDSELIKQRVIANNLIEIFKAEQLGHLVRSGEKECSVHLDCGEIEFAFHITPNSKKEVKNINKIEPKSYKKSIFIPTKEILSFFRGFRILYEEQYLEFDKSYYELARALEKPLKRDIDEDIIYEIESIIGGKIEIFDGRFYLVSGGKKMEINLIAEGYRKIALISYLLSNSALDKSSILFWDEPESNMHPKLIDDIVNYLVKLANMGVQIFISTHSPYIIESFNNHLKKYKIKDKNISDEYIDRLEALNFDDIKVYLLEDGDSKSLLDSKTQLIDDKLLEEFNHLGIVYEKLRDIEWEDNG